jgi:hypothetical protein
MKPSFMVNKSTCKLQIQLKLSFNRFQIKKKSLAVKLVFCNNPFVSKKKKKKKKKTIPFPVAYHFYLLVIIHYKKKERLK